MKRTFWIGAVIAGLAFSLGVAWYLILIRGQDTGPAAGDVEPVGPGTGGAVGNNSPRATKFAELDLDNDGRLSLAEFTGKRKPVEAEKWFKLRDANSDGFVSREEFLPVSAGQNNRASPP